MKTSFCEPIVSSSQFHCSAKSRISLFSFLVLIAPVSMLAAPLTVTSYSMPNGGTGTYIYQDTTYSNCPGSDCTSTGAALSGGTGKLTDGVLPSVDWDSGVNPTSWVGWSNAETNGANPTVTFNFASSVTVNSASIWFDNTLGYGGVDAPASVSIDGVNYVVTPSNVSGPQSFTVSGLNLTGSSINMQFFQGADQWIMIGEVAFNGSSTSSTPTPEPSTFFMGCGLLVATLAMNYLRSKRA